MVEGAAREVGGARADHGQGGRVVTGRNADDGGCCGISTDVVINAGSIAGTALAMGGSWLGADSVVGGTCTGATQAFSTSMTAECAWRGTTLGTKAADCEVVGTEGEWNGIATATASANDNGAGADSRQEGGNDTSG